MATISVWKGAKYYEDGKDLSNYVNIEFEGEFLGSMKYGGGDEERGVTYTFYQVHDGRVVVHEVIWSNLVNENTLGYVHVFSDLEDAAGAFRLHMERANIIDRRTLTLDDL